MENGRRRRAAPAWSFAVRRKRRLTLCGAVSHRSVVDGHPSSDLRVSRLHARIEPTGDGFRVVDHGSQNGVLVTRVRFAELRSTRDELQWRRRMETSKAKTTRRNCVRTPGPDRSTAAAVTQSMRPATQAERAARRLKRVGELMRALSATSEADVFFLT